MTMKIYFFHSAQTFLLISSVRFMAIVATLFLSGLLLHGGGVYAECESDDDCAAGEVCMLEGLGTEAGSEWVCRADATDDGGTPQSGVIGQIGDADTLGIPGVDLDNEAWQNILNVIFLIVGALATIFIVIGGARFVFAAGSPDQIEKAKKTILYAVVGLIVTIVASVIVNFIVAEFV